MTLDRPFHKLAMITKTCSILLEMIHQKSRRCQLHIWKHQ